VLPYSRTPATSSIADDELVRGARADAWLGIARLPGPRRGRGVRPSLGGDRARLPLDEPDPAEAWRERARRLEGSRHDPDRAPLDAIRLYGRGTDLTVGLMPTSVWHAADFTTATASAIPEHPERGMFTTPDPMRADGHVTATRPLEVYGAMMDGIRVEFAGGRAVRIDADSGAGTLRSIAAKDEGSSRLGELALVDGEGRIGPLGTTFYETLLDENAASHIALGNGYDLGVESAEDKARVNQSSVHVDFMIGSPELDVDGLTAGGEAVPLLRGGAWQV
jgi:aminopeptidase